MSTFEGKLLEDSLDFIRIDQFQPKNHSGTYFFLSHFHTDHFKGLFSAEFLKVLSENEEKKVYSSKITRNLLLRYSTCRIPEHKVHVIDDPLTLKHGGRSVLVTPIPAGHCPGSVMFLFELEEKSQETTNKETIRVLYTGDFRIHPDELHKFKALHFSDGSLKKINRLYLDTTFCDPSWISFPSRQQTEEDLVQTAKEWLESNPAHKIGIRYNSYFGLEFLLMKLAKALKTKINVRDFESYVKYSCIPELHTALINNTDYETEANSKIHLCSIKDVFCQACWRNRSIVKTIKPCAMSFNNDQLEVGRLKEGESGVVRIAYSIHCSLEELIGTVNYLKPDNVYACVIPSTLRSQNQMMENLQFDVLKKLQLDVLKNLQLDVAKLKQEREETRRGTASTSSPPSKKFCLSLNSKEEKEPIILDKRLSTLVCLSTDDEEENIPLSQSSIDSPPL